MCTFLISESQGYLKWEAHGFVSGGADFVPSHCRLSGPLLGGGVEGGGSVQFWQGIEMIASFNFHEWGGGRGDSIWKGRLLSSGNSDRLTSRENCPGLLRDPLSFITTPNYWGFLWFLLRAACSPLLFFQSLYLAFCLVFASSSSIWGLS